MTFNEDNFDIDTILGYSTITDVKDNNDNNVCPISLELFKPGDKIVISECNHTFLKNNFIQWAKINGTCPYCRHDLFATYINKKNRKKKALKKASKKRKKELKLLREKEIKALKKRKEEIKASIKASRKASRKASIKRNKIIRYKQIIDIFIRNQKKKIYEPVTNAILRSFIKIKTKNLYHFSPLKGISDVTDRKKHSFGISVSWLTYLENNNKKLLCKTHLCDTPNREKYNGYCVRCYMFKKHFSDFRINMSLP